MLHLPLACHPLGMSLGCRLERLVVAAGLQPISCPLPVDPIEYIANEEGVLGYGGKRQQQAEQEKERASAHQSVFSTATKWSFNDSASGAKTTRNPRNPPLTSGLLVREKLVMPISVIQKPLPRITKLD